MSKRHSESSINPETAAKHIRSSSGKKLANNQDGNDTLQDRCV